jgi:hypothetical protein
VRVSETAEVRCPACGTPVEVQLAVDDATPGVRRADWAQAVDKALLHEAEHREDT